MKQGCTKKYNAQRGERFGERGGVSATGEPEVQAQPADAAHLLQVATRS